MSNRNADKRRTMYIPFAGFYESVHEHAIDWEIEQIAEAENVDWSVVHGATNYRALRTGYAKEYAENVSAWLEHETRDPRDPELLIDLGLTFAALHSPREYNFSTDRIEVEIGMDRVMKMWANVSPATLADVCHERHSDRPGFVSFYDPDFYTWGPVGEWDANQLETLFIAMVRDVIAMDDIGDLDSRIIEFDTEMVSSALVTGVIDETVIGAAKGA